MPVNKDAAGNRSVAAAVEVPGTPEEVWHAIATGPGISSWFVPTTVEEREGGTILANFGPGMDSVSTISVWEPPHRFVADNPDGWGPGAPAVATEWTVEALAGGTCRVRVVHRWSALSDTWDEQFEETTHGWAAFFRTLRLYLTHFGGQPGTAFQVTGVAPEPKRTAWAALALGLGLTDAVVGSPLSAPVGAPPLAGVVEWAGQPAWPEDVLLRLTSPAPGIASITAHEMGGSVFLILRVCLFGPEAAATTAAAEPAWQQWINEQLAPIAAAGAD